MKEKCLTHLASFTTQSGFALIRDINVLLSPLAELTMTTQGDCDITSSMVIPWLYAVKNRWLAIFQACDEERSIVRLSETEELRIDSTFRVSQWKECLLDLWQQYLEDLFSSEHLLISMLLDPRNKLGEALPDTVVDLATNYYCKRLQQLRTPKPTTELSEAASRFVKAAERHSRGEIVGQDARQLADLLSNQASFAADPSKYFSSLPLIRELAMDVLSAPAGEASCERIFSLAGKLVGKNRASLSPTSLSNLCFLKRNTIALN